MQQFFSWLVPPTCEDNPVFQQKMRATAAIACGGTVQTALEEGSGQSLSPTSIGEKFVFYVTTNPQINQIEESSAKKLYQTLREGIRYAARNIPEKVMSWIYQRATRETPKIGMLQFLDEVKIKNKCFGQLIEKALKSPRKQLPFELLTQFFLQKGDTLENTGNVEDDEKQPADEHVLNTQTISHLRNQSKLVRRIFVSNDGEEIGVGTNCIGGLEIFPHKKVGLIASGVAHTARAYEKPHFSLRYGCLSTFNMIKLPKNDDQVTRIMHDKFGIGDVCLFHCDIPDGKNGLKSDAKDCMLSSMHKLCVGLLCCLFFVDRLWCQKIPENSRNSQFVLFVVFVGGYADDTDEEMILSKFQLTTSILIRYWTNNEITDRTGDLLNKEQWQYECRKYSNNNTDKDKDGKEKYTKFLNVNEITESKTPYNEKYSKIVEEHDKAFEKQLSDTVHSINSMDVNDKEFINQASELYFKTIVSHESILKTFSQLPLVTYGYCHVSDTYGTDVPVYKPQKKDYKIEKIPQETAKAIFGLDNDLIFAFGALHSTSVDGILGASSIDTAAWGLIGAPHDCLDVKTGKLYRCGNHIDQSENFKFDNNNCYNLLGLYDEKIVDMIEISKGHTLAYLVYKCNDVKQFVDFKPFHNEEQLKDYTDLNWSKYIEIAQDILVSNLDLSKERTNILVNWTKQILSKYGIKVNVIANATETGKPKDTEINRDNDGWYYEKRLDFSPM